MKTNKKAILGMCVAIVISMGVIGGYHTNPRDITLQQGTVLLTYASASGEYGSDASGKLAVGALVTGYTIKPFASAAVAFGWCPVGWAAGLATGIAVL